MEKLFKGRFSLVFAFIFSYLLVSFATRLLLNILVFQQLNFTFSTFLKIYGLGFLYDVCVALMFSLVYVFYLLVIPKKIIGTKTDKIITKIIVSLLLLIVIFSTLAEFPFWDEFKTRFNFIAVDYLVYTFEVVENIKQSYSIGLLLLLIFSVYLLIFYTFYKRGYFNAAFSDKMPFKARFMYAFILISISIVGVYGLTNKLAETNTNIYVNELSKNGVFSFFAAFRSNELDYDLFYPKIDEEKAYSIVKKELLQETDSLIHPNDTEDISRKITNVGTEQTPNIIVVCIESLSAEFMGVFGNKENLSPHLDEITKNSLFFTNIYATGTRTVRGMEAITLSVPPTPGNSIVRRDNNDSLVSIATILRAKNYHLNFIYGGDGYFDNMNTFFGGQGFDIVDRDRGNPLSDEITTTRKSIDDNQVTFENAWGICDEDIYKQAIKHADIDYLNKKHFFEFVMTTSNHKPYTFPKTTLNLDEQIRENGVRYTDYAIDKFLKAAKDKPWFKNTIFVFIADHCASSAGKFEINIEKHHIPAIIYNSNYKANINNTLASQIDIMPTLFGLLHWNYTTELFGKDIYKTKPSEARAFIGNYRTVGLLKNNYFTQIDNKKQVTQFNWNEKEKTLNSIKNENIELKNQTIAYYQIASHRFKNNLMKVFHKNKINNQL